MLAFKLADIGISVFLPHSMRRVSTSAVAGKTHIDLIIRTAGWRKDSTFRKFCKCPVTDLQNSVVLFLMWHNSSGVISTPLDMGRVKRKQSAFEHAQSVQIHIALHMRRVSSAHLLSIETVYSIQ